MKKFSKWGAAFLIGLFALMVTSSASAHVTVRPDMSQTNAYEKYTVRVPVEKEINTTEVTLEVPKGVTLVSVMPMIDWDYKMNKNKDDVVTSVVWTAKGKGIGPNEFNEFSFIGANPEKAGEVSWKALQKYDDGSVVKWTGAPDSDLPASVTKIEKADESAGHSHGAPQTEEKSSETDHDSGSMNWLPITLSAVALVLAIVGLLRRRS